MLRVHIDTNMEALWGLKLKPKINLTCNQPTGRVYLLHTDYGLHAEGYTTPRTGPKQKHFSGA